MQRKPARFDKSTFVSQTYQAQSTAQHYIDLAEKLTQDPEKERRNEKGLCVSCHYIPRMAGAAVTKQPCACCGKEQTYGSTSTDALCMECAKKNKLCKRCSGDSEQRTNRRKWPAGPDYGPVVKATE